MESRTRGDCKMPKVHLTQTMIQKAEIRDARYTIRDDSPGLILRVGSSGSKVFYVDYFTTDGKRSLHKIGSAEVLTVTQAREAAKDFLARIALGEEIPGKRTKFNEVTLGEYLEQSYFPWVTVNRKSGDKTVQMLRAAFAFLWDVDIKELSAMAIERWRTERVQEVKAASLNRLLSALKSALNWGFKRNVLDFHPLERMEHLQERDSQPKVRYLSPEERARLMAALDAREKKMKVARESHNRWLMNRHEEPMPPISGAFADHIKPMVLISLNTGIRRGALFSLLWEDVDLKRKMLTLRAEEDKAKKMNYVPLNNVAFDTFVKWRQQSPDEIFVFPSPVTGKRIDNCRSAWDTLMKMAEIENFRWHDMRHDFASQLVMHGVDLNTIRELLGHADLKMTLRYAHLAPEAKGKAVSLLD